MIIGKVGKVLVAQEELDCLFSDSRKEQKKPFKPQGEQQQNLMAHSSLVATSIIRKSPVHHVKLRYTNPLKTDINPDLSTDKQLIRLFNSVSTPNLTSFSKLFTECENMKKEYSGLILIEPLDKDMPSRQNSGVSKHLSRESSQKSQGSIKRKENFEEDLALGYDENESPFKNNAPKDLKTVFREQDIKKFIELFKCPRETAVWYLDAYGDYKQACQHYLENQ